jgi:hypothetical protein
MIIPLTTDSSAHSPQSAWRITNINAEYSEEMVKDVSRSLVVRNAGLPDNIRWWPLHTKVSVELAMISHALAYGGLAPTGNAQAMADLTQKLQELGTSFPIKIVPDWY